MESPEHKKRDVRRYMELEAPDEHVTQLERVSTERILTDRYDVWDVHTDKGRWWVVSPLTNLYSQADFPSMENVLTFHVGLGARLANRRETQASDEDRGRTAIAWRKWTQAAKALDEADEAEEFQAVGMRLRECMITYVQEVAHEKYLEEGMEPPKRADFVNWIELIANKACSGESAARLRSYLKNMARSTWELVNWLIHASNATRFDAEICLSAVDNLLSSLLMVVLKFERGLPERCRECSSYRLLIDERELENDEWQDFILCEVCGWEQARTDVD